MTKTGTPERAIAELTRDEQEAEMRELWARPHEDFDADRWVDLALASVGAFEDEDGNIVVPEGDA